MANNSNNSTSVSTKVQVALRIRPLTADDLVTLPSRFQRQILSTNPFTPNQVVVQAERKQNYTFDHVFGPEASQKEIYDRSVKHMVDKFLEGFNVTILAYGQTSSGKTYTMGTSDNSSLSADEKGIIPRSMTTLFSYINSAQYKNRKCTMKVSFVEIYNEDLIDLLADKEEESRPQVMIREDSKGNIIWSGLQEVKVNSVEEVMGNLTRGSLLRQVGATEMNSQSSRSHAIFSVTLSQQKFVPSGPVSPTGTPTRPSSRQSGSPSRSGSRMGRRTEEGDWVSVTSKFHFVDLAGSERLKRTSAIGERAKEGISINSGLLALGNVISALGDPTKNRSTTHVPYRDSKLTRLLQDSLGGNAQTLMIACVSPAEYNVSETVNTLKYANRARNIKNNATVTQEEAGWHDLEHLQNLVLKLRAEVKALKQTSESGRTTPNESRNSRRLSTPLSIITNGLETQAPSKNKDIDSLEEQLVELQRCYSELMQKYTKTSEELSMYQDNMDLLSSKKIDQQESAFSAPSSESFQETIGPLIAEYEKSIAELENNLRIARASLANSEQMMHEQESKLGEAEELNSKNQGMISDLKNMVSKLTEREEISENYINDLESKLEAHASEQKKDRETINDLRSRIAQLRLNSEKNEGVIQKLELRLAKSENKVTIMNETTQNLERALHEREDAYMKLELKYKKEKSLDEQDQNLLMSEIEERDRRIAQLEKKVEELVTEISQMKKLRVDSKYQSCIDEINELNSRLQEVKIPKYGVTLVGDSAPMSPVNPDFVQDSESLSTHIHGTHRKAKSLSAEIQGAEKRELSSMAMVQKLQIELKQLELLHADKEEGLIEVKKEFARLEVNHLETLEIVSELREELKRRDALAQIEVMSVMTSEYSYAESGYSAATSEIDQYDIVHRLRDEVEQLKEEQKRNLDIIASYNNGVKSEEVLKIESNINLLKAEIQSIIERQNKEDTNEETLQKLQIQLKELEEQLAMTQEAQRQIIINNAASQIEGKLDVANKNDELKELRQQVEKLQNEIEVKSHTIAALLFPSVEQQNNIRELEDELRETREAYSLAFDEKNSKLNTITEENGTTSDSIDKKIEELEEKIKSLEDQLAKAKETPHVPVHQNPEIDLVDPSYKTIEVLEEKLSALQRDLSAKSEVSEDLKSEHETITALQGQLEALKLDMHHKHELIGILKRDLADKAMLQQKLREKETEALAFRTKLMEVHKQEEDLEREMNRLKTLLHKLESGDDVSKVLQDELESLRNELKDVRARESVALERLRVLKARLGSDQEESVLQEQLEHLRIVEIAQRERIAVLEDRLSEKGEKVDEDLVILRTDLAIAKETESAQKRVIENLEAKLKKAEERSQAVNLKRELAGLKAKEMEQNKKIQELEFQLSESNNKDSQQVKQLKEEIEKLRAHEREQRRQIETLENRLDLIKDEDPTVSSLRDQIAGLKASEFDLRRTVQDLESKLVSAQREINIFETVKEEVAFLKELESEQKSTIEQLQSQLRKIRNAKEAAVRELQTMKGGFSIQKELAISLEEELKTLRQELASAKDNTSSSSVELEELSALLSDAQKQRDEAQRRVKTLEIEVETYKIAGVAGKENVGALREELSNAKLEMVAQNEILVDLEAQMKNMEKERDQSAQRVSELMEALEKREANQRDAVRELESTLMNLETELVMAKDNEKMDKEMISNLEEKLSFVRLQLEEAKASDERRTRVINELEAKLKEALSVLTERESGINNQDVLIVELEALIRNTQFELQAAKLSETDAAARVKELESKLAEASKLELDSAATELKAYKAELDKVKASEAKFIQQVKNLENKLQGVQEQHSQEITKLQQVNEEVNTLREQCTRLQAEIDDANHDSVIQCYENIDDDVIEDLTNELRKARDQAQAQQERVEELEKIANQLESEKKIQAQRNEDHEAEVKQLQKDLEILAEDFAEAAAKFEDADELSRQQKDQIAKLEKALQEAKKSPLEDAEVDQRLSGSTNPVLAKLASANEQLRQTNDHLNVKIAETEDQTRKLVDKVKSLESELSRLNAHENKSIKELKDKINVLEVEKECLEEENKTYVEEQGKLDQKIEFLMQQLRSVGSGKTSTQIAELNGQIIKLEKELANLKQQSLANSKEMEKEIERLLELNFQLEQGIKGTAPSPTRPNSASTVSSSHGSVSSVNSREQSKLTRQENKISQQNSLIKSLQERITELEKRSNDGNEVESGIRSSTSSTSSSSSDIKKSGIRPITGSLAIAPPPTPPPSHPPPPPPSGTPPATPGNPTTPRSPLPPNLTRNRSDSNVSSEIASEVQKLHKKIEKMEGESVQNRQLVETLESTLNENENNLRVAKKQLSILQREKSDYLEQIKKLKSQLDDAQQQVEQARSTVQEEKKLMESVLEEERKAKEKAEKARSALENQMEQLMAKKNKFMCF
ncbi:13239_t:CDS:2 [Acaulospora morrowiae]|uniref:13239_t:CDS:1 n=1 Tax=Acaulospora morrowiae TaxID=94023 RepID=A0A9N8YQR0_9GLOM|nr:13239_t:CDS:2 [Acaulospora morrowiae]